MKRKRFIKKRVKKLVENINNREGCEGCPRDDRLPCNSSMDCAKYIYLWLRGKDLKQRKKSKDPWDWNNYSNYNWRAQDENGYLWYYSKKPRIITSIWDSDYGQAIFVGKCLLKKSWTDTLEKRPLSKELIGDSE